METNSKETKYFNYKDKPAKWEYRKLPVVYKNRKEIVVDDLGDFLLKWLA